jgi:hypothetical protein
MGFLMDEPEAEDGRVQLIGEEKDEAAILCARRRQSIYDVTSKISKYLK